MFGGLSNFAKSNTPPPEKGVIRNLAIGITDILELVIDEVDDLRAITQNNLLRALDAPLVIAIVKERLELIKW